MPDILSHKGTELTEITEEEKKLNLTFVSFVDLCVFVRKKVRKDKKWT